MDTIKKIVIFSTADNGGAGTYNLSLAEALVSIGHEVQIIVANKFSNNKFVKQVKPTFGELLRKKVKESIFKKQLALQRKVAKEANPDFYFFNYDEAAVFYNIDAFKRVIAFKPDVIIASWVSQLINTEQLSNLGFYFGARLYTLMADMSPITGGCHYAWDCKGYTTNCNNCPALPEQLQFVAAKNWQKKNEAIQKAKIKGIPFSPWGKNQMSNAGLFKHQKHFQTLQGYINPTIFNTDARNIAKEYFKIPKEKIAILVGAIDTKEKRKGAKFLLEALVHISINNASLLQNVVLLVVGNSSNTTSAVPIYQIPFIKDERLLALLYQSADFYANTSIEDTGPQMVLQAMACGAIVVSFPIGFGSEFLPNQQAIIATEVSQLAYTNAISNALTLTVAEKLQMQQASLEKIKLENGIQSVKDFANYL